MSRRSLKIVKKQQKRTISKSYVGHYPRLSLTPAEEAEVTRFKGLTLKRAARQARIREMMRKMDESDYSNVA